MRPTPVNTPLMAITLPATVRLPATFDTTRPPSNRSLPLVRAAPGAEAAVTRIRANAKPARLIFQNAATRLLLSREGVRGRAYARAPPPSTCCRSQATHLGF